MPRWSTAPTGPGPGLRRAAIAPAEGWKATKNPDRARWAAHTAVLAPIATVADQAQALDVGRDGARDRAERAERLALQGAALLRAGRTKDAVAALGKAVAKGGDDAPPSAFAWLALAHRQLGHPAERPSGGHGPRRL